MRFECKEINYPLLFAFQTFLTWRAMQSQRVQIKINKLTRTLGGDLKETVSTLRPQPPSPLVFLFLIKPMWRPATRQITGTNDGALEYFLCNIRFCHFIVVLVPLGTRRRFGPAPAE